MMKRDSDKYLATIGVTGWVISSSYFTKGKQTEIIPLP